MRVNIEGGFSGAYGAGVGDGVRLDWVTTVENSYDSF